MAAPLQRGDQAASPPTRQRVSVTPDRERLAAAIQAVRQTERDLAKLTGARDRARDQRWSDSATLHDAETTLSALRDRETARARQAFVDGQPDVSPLPQAEAAVAQAQRALSKTEGLEQSIDAEIASVEQRLDYQRHQLDEAVGRVLVASPELAALNRAIRDCWMRLRTLRGVMAAVNHAIPHAAPDRVLDDWQAVEAINPGDPRDPVDFDLINAWVTAVTALHDDAEASLPGG
jgi:hypothetical protein